MVTETEPRIRPAGSAPVPVAAALAQVADPNAAHAFESDQPIKATRGRPGASDSGAVCEELTGGA